MYTVQYSDLIGNISEFPIEVVQKMVERSTEQRKWDDAIGMSTFQENISSAGSSGFRWETTPEDTLFGVG